MTEQDLAPQGLAPRPAAGEPGSDPAAGELAPLAPGPVSLPDPAPAPALAPIDPRTGEPRIPLTVRVASILCYLAVANITGALLWVYWSAVPRDNFANASWLMGQFVTEPGSWQRVLLAVAVTVIALLCAVPAAITGYYAWTGYRWTRISSIIAVVLSLGALTLNVYAWPTMLWAAVAAALLWLRPTTIYFATWWARRHPQVAFAPPTVDVFYGPLPRYRA